MPGQLPQGLDTKHVQQLLDAAKASSQAGARIDLLSARLVGRPYQANPLIGSTEKPEVFTARTDCYDCVTFLETVFSLAHSRQIPAFVKTLRQIRYASGKIAWTHRNHYMTEWIQHNLRTGRVGSAASPR
jgi:hypothetical protein